MKRQFFLFCLAFILSQQISAQGFFKKLGKALSESAKEMVNGGAVTQQTKWGNVTIKHQIPNLSISLQNVERNGNSAVVTLLFTNTGSNQLKVYSLYHQKTYDSQGNEYSARCQVGNELLVLGDTWSKFEPDIPLKVYYIINNVPNNTFTLKLLKFESGYYPKSQGQYTDAFIEVRNVTVPEMTVNTQAINTQTATKPFKGDWATKDGEFYLNVDLYAKSIEVEYGEPLTHGTLAVFYGNSRDVNVIQSATITGNTAVLTMECQNGGNGEKVTAKLVYNPTTKTMTVSDAKYHGDSWCVLDGNDPVVLYKKK